MGIREINGAETGMLLPFLSQLADHHNRVSVHFKGFYPSKPYAETLNAFSAGIKSGLSHIAVIEDAGQVLGFCKIDITGGSGKLDYLTVLAAHRGKGYGTKLMEWAMAIFRSNGIGRIEVKVVDGNDAIRLYEKFGFKINAHLLWYSEA